MAETENIYTRFEREFAEWEKIAHRRNQRRAELLAWFFRQREVRALVGGKGIEKSGGEE